MNSVKKSIILAMAQGFVLSLVVLFFSSCNRFPEGPVDLGVSVEWASANVGAAAPYEVGGYYSWGMTETRENYGFSGYPHTSGSWRDMIKYCLNDYYGKVDGKSVLEPCDDAATAALGEGWRTPTEAEWNELIAGCDWKWKKVHGVKGYVVSNRTDDSKAIFIPASGFYQGEKLLLGNGCYYWSANLDKDYGDYGRYACLKDCDLFTEFRDRVCGLPVRAVKGAPAADAEPEAPAAPATEITLEVPAEGNAGELLGMGCEMDPMFSTILQDDRYDSASLVEDWKNIHTPRIKDLSLSRIRVMLQPQWIEPVNDDDDPDHFNWDAFTFDSPYMQQVERELTLAQETGMDVLLDLWGCTFGHFLRAEDAPECWASRTGDDKEFAECFCAVLKYYIDKGFTCIKEVTPYNEPECGVANDMEHYVPTAKVLYEKLRKEGIDVKLNLSDNTDTRRWWLEETVENLYDYAGLFNSHTYIHGRQTPNSVMYNWEKRNVAACKGKTHYIQEFGCCGGNPVGGFERGVTVSRLAVNYMNAGAAGCSLWPCYDQYYSKNSLHDMGLWRYKKVYYDASENVREDYEIKPFYYAYSLLGRYFHRGSRVYPLETGDEFAAASAVRSAEGAWTYVIVNQNNRDIDFTIYNPHEGGMEPCTVYAYANGLLPSSCSYDREDLLVTLPATLSADCNQGTSEDGAFHILVPAHSVIYLAQ